MISAFVLRIAILLGTVFLLLGCSFGSEPPLVAEIEAQPSTTIVIGDTASLTIAASGIDLRFDWAAQRGTLSESTKPSVIYRAPSSPGPDTVTVKITNSGGQIVRNITFTVVEPPTPTVTSIATIEVTSEPTQTPTFAPPPIVCNHPAVTKNIFSQLANENGQFPFYGPLTEPKFLCEAVYDLVHIPGKMAIHIKYENVGTNFGWWGIATPNGYDASRHRQLCFWAYAKQSNQSFRVKIKDTTHKERGDIVTVEVPNEWAQICTDVSRFQEQGIEVSKMDNVNLGFEEPSGSAEIWVADFEFK
jgi:hypothetical protein